MTQEHTLDEKGRVHHSKDKVWVEQRADGYESTESGIARLQQTIGNRAVQRLLAQCNSAASSGEAFEIDDDTAGRIDRERGGGQPLGDAVQMQMGEAMGYDFSGVRVHTSSEADGLNRQLSAKAFTTGRDVFFREGTYQPRSASGKGLIAHELTHVAQQQASPMVQRDVAHMPTETTTATEGATESTQTPEENPLLIWTNEVVIPVTRAHTVLAGSGPAGELRLASLL